MYVCEHVIKERGYYQMKIYCMSDIHGYKTAFEKALSLIDLSGDNKLILLGDYVHEGPASYEVLKMVYELEKKYGPDKVIVLMGNHEELYLQGVENKDPRLNEDLELKKWVRKLRIYYTTETQIFVHAGVDEEAEDLWHVGTSDDMFLWKFPPTTGKFYKDIIVGHVGTHVLAKDPNYHDIYFDGESHYYISGSVYDSGVINILMYDDVKKKYYSVVDGEIREIPEKDMKKDHPFG